MVRRQATLEETFNAPILAFNVRLLDVLYLELPVSVQNREYRVVEGLFHGWGDAGGEIGLSHGNDNLEMLVVGSRVGPAATSKRNES